RAAGPGPPHGRTGLAALRVGLRGSADPLGHRGAQLLA
ncbi:MAG: hypothetical protein QOH86_1900, partial [Sphingomonadales bacterium]|nr:hypothetical protein [Sphingomonadales bacterium]